LKSNTGLHKPASKPRRAYADLLRGPYFNEIVIFFSYDGNESPCGFHRGSLLATKSKSSSLAQRNHGRRAGLIPRRPPADVAAAEAAGPVDAVDGGVSAIAGGCKIATGGGDTKYAPAIGDQPLIVAARAGVK
jgi:hypothetical protein